ncbi:hypothetical protein BDW22DRAFT_818430 [Trametopsis cervina]|nr:hypothetical protein BDW22DRAFT_818430 [Trametopsis cervina]
MGKITMAAVGLEIQQCRLSISNMHICDCCRENEATQRCSGCRKKWYCNQECQSAKWPLHIFECNPQQPINTAYHLTLAISEDTLPTDPLTLREWGFDKADLISDEAPFKLFGLYVGLIKSLGVKPQQLHKWRIRGTLIAEIKAKYEAFPVGVRGEYYPWFLEHQYILV